MKIHNYAAIVLGMGLALAILPGIFQQGAFATAYGGDSSQDMMIANPTGSNVTNGNMTNGNATGLGEQNIPTANTTGVESVAVTPWTD